MGDSRSKSEGQGSHFHTSPSTILAFMWNKSLAPSLDLQGHDSNQQVSPCPDFYTTPTDYGSHLDLDWGGWICALTHKTACKNDTLPFTHLMKKSVLNNWSNSQVKSDITCAGLFFSSPPHFLTSWLQPIVPAFLSQLNKMGWWENNLVCLFPRQ